MNKRSSAVLEKQFKELIAMAMREGYSDIHICGGSPLVFRKNGRIQFDHRLSWTHEDMDNLIAWLVKGELLHRLRTRLSVDFARTVSNSRLRMNAFVTLRGFSLAVRLLPGTVPRLNNLNIHPTIQQYCHNEAGLILVCGPTGSGKSTTIAAMVEEVNETRPVHIITLEDPIEYRFTSKRSFVEQRELGTHMISFEQGLLDVLREDPDVIVVGELRERQVMRLTLDAAESGHLVIASLHSATPEEAIYRICNAFPIEAQTEVRNQLSTSLLLIVVQHLQFLESTGFQVPLLTIMRSNQAIRSLIRDNKVSQIESAMQTAKGEGMFTSEAYLTDYLNYRNQFVPPSSVFRPSALPPESPDYTPPILRSGTARRQTPAAPVPGENEQETLFPITPLKETGQAADAEAGDYHLTIEENSSLEDLIAQMQKTK
ncbi:MAG: PilT/PilU family type 4a pilus ATPase [Syntrophaceae bacterium]|nr:PilT/PilU family type 4a pilus ATPase [Syntrophaceae bacterium]